MSYNYLTFGEERVSGEFQEFFGDLSGVIGAHTPEFLVR